MKHTFYTKKIHLFLEGAEVKYIFLLKNRKLACAPRKMGSENDFLL